MAKEIYIAGEWRLGRGAVIQSLFPADQSVNAEISTATLEDVNEAIEKADQAWRQPADSGCLRRISLLCPLIVDRPLRPGG